MKRAPKAWTEEKLKKCFGDEYPKAVIRSDVRFPLTEERLFSRSFQHPDLKQGYMVSRFMDGSAGIDFGELTSNWFNWSDFEKVDFCQECSWLSGQEDFPDMIRFVMRHGSQRHWSAIATEIASELPKFEAFDFLLSAFESAPPGWRSNLLQGLALTKHSSASELLRDHLCVWVADPLTWQPDEFMNDLAGEAIVCIDGLIRLGASPIELEHHVCRLAEHDCKGTRRSCRGYFSKHYPWLGGESNE